MTIYAVGDIHGQMARLAEVMDLIARDGGPDAEIVFLGDYTDRGPDSRAVLAFLVAGQAEGRNWRFLLGNHDRLFLRFLTDGQENDSNMKSRMSWLNPRLGGTETLSSYGLAPQRTPTFLLAQNGGWETLHSYGLGDRDLPRAELSAAVRAAVPAAHVRFLQSLEPHIATDDILFVHAGLRPGVPLADQTVDDLIWIRGPFLDDASDHGWLVVHGHTPVDRPEHRGNRVDLDTGAGYGRALTAAAIEGRDVFILTPAGRVPLLPGA